MNCTTFSIVKSSLAECLAPISFVNNSVINIRRKRVVPMKFRVIGFLLNLISRLNNEWAAKQLSKNWFTVFKSRPKPWVVNFWNQADHRIEVNLVDQIIPVYLWGKGPLVVLMHGWCGSGTQFRHFIPALTKAGYKVAVFDAPEHGANPGKYSNILHFSDSLVSIQQQIGPVDTVIAHSFGAMAVTLATHRGLIVKRLVLIAPHLDIQVIFDSYSQLLKLRTKLVQRFKDLVGAKMADILQIENPWELLNTKTLLSDTGQNGLLVFDDEDEEVPQSHFNEIERHWINSEVIKTQELGHAMVLKDSEVIRKIVVYLNLKY